MLTKPAGFLCQRIYHFHTCHSLQPPLEVNSWSWNFVQKKAPLPSHPSILITVAQASFSNLYGFPDVYWLCHNVEEHFWWIKYYFPSFWGCVHACACRVFMRWSFCGIFCSPLLPILSKSNPPILWLNSWTFLQGLWSSSHCTRCFHMLYFTVASSSRAQGKKQYSGSSFGWFCHAV